MTTFNFFFESKLKIYLCSNYEFDPPTAVSPEPVDVRPDDDDVSEELPPPRHYDSRNF